MEIENVILETISQKIGEKRFEMWFGKDIHFELRHSVLFVSLPTPFLCNWIRTNFKHIIAQACEDLFGKVFEMEFLVADDQENSTSHSRNISQQDSSTNQSPIYQVHVSKDRPISFSHNVDKNSEKNQPNIDSGLSSQKKINKNSAIILNSQNNQGIVNPAESSSSLKSLGVNQPSRPLSDIPHSRYSNVQESNLDSSNHQRSDIGCSVSQTSGISDSTGSFKRSLKMDDLNSFAFLPKTASTESVQSEKTSFAFPSKESSPSSTKKTVSSGKSSKSLKKNASDSAKSSETPLFLTDEKGNFNIVPHQPPKASVSGHSFSDQDREFASYSTFVVGLSNRLAKSVSDLIILEPGKMSPLMIYGSTSVGKTHLLEGIWSEYRRKPNRRSPLFMTAEQFTSQFILSLRTNGQPFRNRFKNISLFVLDDVQFLQGKISTQTELLNLIDYLKSQNIQMVFSADRPLAELNGLKSEIISRIEGGIVCQIDNPERETLLGIFRQMMKKRHLNIPEDVCRFVVSRFTTHARQLSGVLNRLHASFLATGQPFSLEMAEESLKDIIRSNHRTIHLEDIEKAVKDIFGLADNSLQSRSRTKQVCYPRMLAMWLARKHTRNALSEIGRYFGNRSHSTVISAQKKVEQWLLDNNSPLEQGEYIWTVSETIQRIERILNH